MLRAAGATEPPLQQEAGFRSLFAPVLEENALDTKILLKCRQENRSLIP
jgi:hypothetical protein